jgi:hypothetical protein
MQIPPTVHLLTHSTPPQGVSNCQRSVSLSRFRIAKSKPGERSTIRQGASASNLFACVSPAVSTADPLSMLLNVAGIDNQSATFHPNYKKYTTKKQAVLFVLLLNNYCNFFTFM